MRLVIWLVFLVIQAPCGADFRKENDLSEFYMGGINYERPLSLPSCDGLSQPSLRLCTSLRKADDIARTCDLSVYQGANNELMREFCIVAYEPTSKLFRTIQLEMPVFQKKDFQPRVKTIVTPPYIVKRVAGDTFIKMRFEISRGGIALFAYSAKYIKFPSGTKSGSLESLQRGAETLVYLAGDDYMDAPGIAERGCGFVRSLLVEAHRDVSGVPSRAFPGKTVTENITADMVLKGILAEQTDDVDLFGRNGERLNEKMKENDAMKEQAFRRVCVHIFKNGHEAYRHIWSEAKAGGVLQFTNTARIRHGKLFPGTYDAVRSFFPQAALDPDFRRGVQSVRNSGKAAIVYLDYALSNKNIAGRARKLFARDPEVGILLGFAEYNGGPEQARRLSEFLEKYEEKVRRPVTLETIPWRQLEREGGLPRQTFCYLAKLGKLHKVKVEETSVGRR
jgi:hypothetical protein